MRFAFPHDIKGEDGKPIGEGRMYVFTTRADTIMGVTFCAVAPEHQLAAHAAASRPDCPKLSPVPSSHRRHLLTIAPTKIDPLDLLKSFF